MKALTNTCVLAVCATLSAWVSPSQAAILTGNFPNADHPSLQMWLDAGQLPNASPVGTWTDRSSQGNDVSQGTGSAQPNYVANDPVFFNRPSVEFDGVNDLLSGASASGMGIDGAAARTIFVAYRKNTTANRNILGYGIEAGGQMFDVLLHSNEFVGHFYGGGFDTLTETTQTYPTNALVIGGMSYDGTTVRSYQHDGGFNGQLASKVLALNTGDSAFVVGSGIYGPFFYYDGAIAEVLVYNELLSEEDREAVDNYLYTKYTTAFVENNGVPEPSTLGLLGLGMLGWAASARRRRRSA